MDDPRWLAAAWREFGQAERAGESDNLRILALTREIGHPEVAHDETAWCAAFVGACLERAGLPSTRSLAARSYLAWGEPLAAPRIGAIAVLSRGSNPAEGHVGFWLGETDDGVVLLGGNQSDAVGVAAFPSARLLALRWPSAVAAEGEARPASAETAPIFERALAHVLAMEGGFSDDRYDPGGPTNLGITLAVFAAWRGAAVGADNRDALIRDLKALDVAAVRPIYRSRYWDPAGCDALAPSLALMHFDAAVNQGVGAANRILQEAVRAGVDGEIGPETRAAVAAMPLLEALDRYAAIRERRYRALPHFWRFGRGWLRRVAETRALARRIADETSNQQQGDTDMTSTSTDETAGKWWGHSITIWGTIITVISTVLPALAPVTGVDISGDLVQSAGEQVVETIQAVGALAGTLMTIYGRIRATQPIEKVLFKSKG